MSPQLGGAIALALLLAAVEAGLPSVSRAACNVIPQAQGRFRGILATADRPFASPGDFLTLSLDPICHRGTTEDQRPSPFADLMPGAVVTIAFAPLRPAPPAPAPPGNLLVLAPDCEALADKLTACAPHLGGRMPLCKNAIASSPSPDIELIDVEDELSLGGKALRIRFPDSRDVAFGDPLAGYGAEMTLAGPARVAVSTTADALPCALATGGCPSTASGGIRACLDRLFVKGDTCSPAADDTFAHFTALPIPNNFQGACSDPDSVCTGRDDELRMTIDTGGNLLVPVEWSGTLVRDDAVPVPRALEAVLKLESYPGTGAPLLVPGRALAASYSPHGQRIEPVFDPLYDPEFELANPGRFRFFGTTDAPRSVLRLGRHDATYVESARQCSGGAMPGLPCTCPASAPGESCLASASACGGGGAVCSPEKTCFFDGVPTSTSCRDDADCPGGQECGPGLFDFRTRLTGDVGPITLRRGACLGGTAAGQGCGSDASCPGGQCGDFDLAARDPFPLDGLVQTTFLNALVREEAIVDRDLNGDGDATDHVVTLASRSTGREQEIGDAAGVAGRAIARIREGAFSFPALAAEADVLAFLEPESLQGGLDVNGNGLVFDAVLRVYSVLGGAPISLLPPTPLAVDPAPVFRGRSLVASSPYLFFREAEWHAAPSRRSILIDVAETEALPPRRGHPSAVSADGSLVTFETGDGRVGLAGIDAGTPDEGVFLVDLRTGDTERVSPAFCGTCPEQPRLDNCCEAHGARGCSDMPTRRCVCRIMPSCCSTGWTQACAEIAADSCGARCGAHDCCVARGTPGCNDEDIERCVCASDDSCCMSAWDESCVAEVRTISQHGAPDRRVRSGSMSADGRRIAFESAATNLSPAGEAKDCIHSPFVFVGVNSSLPCADVYVRDREANRTIRASVSNAGVISNGTSSDAVLSASGRFVAFTSHADNLDGGEYPICLTPRDLFVCPNVFLRDLEEETTTRISVRSDGRAIGEEGCHSPQISGDGDRLAFICPMPQGSGIFLHDRLSGATEEVPGPAGTLRISLSNSGRFLAFESSATEWVAGDTNGERDVFVYDLEARVVRRASIASDGAQANGTSLLPALSPDARFVAFYSSATNLAAGDGNGLPDLFVHDLATQMTSRLGASRSLPGASAPNVFFPNPPRISEGARTVAYVEFADEFLEAGVVVARAPDEADASKDSTGDGRLDDVILRAVALAEEQPEPMTLCPATEASAAGGKVAFLRPERAGPAPKLGSTCPLGMPVGVGTDLNGDGDADDDVVHLWTGAGPVRNLQRAASALSISDAWIGALVPEEDEGEGALNGDGDTDDEVAFVRRIDEEAWIPTGLAANEIVTGGNTVAFTVPEASQGGASLNPGRSFPDGGTLPGDADLGDDVLFVYDGKRRQVVSAGIAAEEFVVGETNGIVAFRALESAQGGRSLNDVNGNDSDANDGVFFVFAPDVSPPQGPLIATRMAVLPCALEVCDPRLPYRVLDDTIRFLTFECDQGGNVVDPLRCPGGGTDLDGDGKATSVVLQMINVAQLATGAAMSESCHVLASAVAGVCTSSGTGCTRDADCATASQEGTCFVPPGGCIRDLPDTPCTPSSGLGVPPPCPGPNRFCQPTGPGSGYCREVQKKCIGGANAGASCAASEQCPDGACVSRCRTTDDCSSDAICNQSDQTFQRLVNPLKSDTEQATSSISTGAGRCVEVRADSDCTTSDQCERGEFCNGGQCARDHDTCRSHADCPAGATCEQDLLAQTATDSDRDEVPDFLDNCPEKRNPNQRDRDGDGIGDRCDEAQGGRPARDDYDGDRIADIAIYDEVNGGVRFLGTGRQPGQGPAAIAGVGGNRQVIVQADYDGDGRTDAAAYHKGTGRWVYKSSAAGGGTAPLVALATLGGRGFTPVQGDYDGDGRADPAVYEKATGIWRYVGSSAGPQMIASVTGTGVGYAPAPGDFDGDGKSDPCVYERATGSWIFDGTAAGRQQVLGIGGPGLRPVPGDYDGDRKTDAAAYEASTGRWVYQGSRRVGGAPPLPREVLDVGSSASGGGKYVPAQADVDGDRRTDPCAYQPSTGRWEFFGSRAGRGGVTAFGSRSAQPALGLPNVK